MNLTRCCMLAFSEFLIFSDTDMFGLVPQQYSFWRYLSYALNFLLLSAVRNLKSETHADHKDCSIKQELWRNPEWEAKWMRAGKDLKNVFFSNLLCRAGHPSFCQASLSSVATQLTTGNVIPGSAQGPNWPCSVWLHKNSHKNDTQFKQGRGNAVVSDIAAV